MQVARLFRESYTQPLQGGIPTSACYWDACLDACAFQWGTNFNSYLVPSLLLGRAEFLTDVTTGRMLATLFAGSVFAESGSASCAFLVNTDCTGLVTPPGYLRNFGADAAAQQKCCDLCANNTACATAVLATDQGGVCMLKPADTTCSFSHNRVKCSPSNKPPTPGPAPPTPPPAPLVPKWKPTFNMSESTCVMPCTSARALFETSTHSRRVKCRQLHWPV